MRRLRVTLLDSVTGAAAEALVDVTAGAVVAHRALDTEQEGQPPVTFEEYEIVEQVVKADPGWRKAMAERGVTDLDLAVAAPSAPARCVSRTGPAPA